VGTRRGDFIKILRDTIGDISLAAGVDINEKDLATAYSTRDSAQTVFAAASADMLPFADGTFDIVAMANALHHLPEVDRALAEMLRVLRPGGRLLIAEYIRDNPTPPQMSLMAMHDLGGDIARLAGISHRAFYDKSEVLAIIDSLGLDNLRTAEYTAPEITTDPVEINRQADNFFSSLSAIAGNPSYTHHTNEAVVARLRAVRTGIQRPAQLIVLGTKRSSDT
jgi:ubiquinone/menaquinone biosynthesis C-methylase UbiE